MTHRNRRTRRLGFGWARAALRATLVFTALLPAACGDETPESPAIAHVVSGTVFSELGAPVQQASVCLTDRDWQTAGGDLLVVQTTDPAGGYAFTNVPEDEFRLHANVGDTLAATTTLSIPRGTAAVVQAAPLMLDTACICSGIARWGVAEADTDIVVFAEELFASVAVDSTGHFRLAGLPPGTWAISAVSISPPGSARGSVTLPAPGDSATIPDLVLTRRPVSPALRARALAHRAKSRRS